MNPPFSEITSFSELTKRSTAYDTPSTNVRSIVKQEIDKAQAKNSLDNADKANKSIVDTPEFKTGLDNYFEEIDKSNQTCRCITFWSMLTFGVLTTFIIIMVDVFVNNGYQEFDPIVGFVTSSVSGVALAKSPLMSASDAIVYDARDIVVPPKEKNALFVTTKSYAVEKQARGTCMGMDKCECLSPDKDCSQCLRGSSGTSGLYTGRCVKISADGVAPEDRRCEVTAWCPVMGFQRMQESQSGALDPSLTMTNVDQFKMKFTVNARFPAFQMSTSYNFSQNVVQAAFDGDQQKYEASVKRGGAIIFVQFHYDCDVDKIPARKCKPTITTTRLDDFNANEDGPQKGYGFKTVDYFLGSDSIMSRRVRQVQGLRFIFDVTGRARQYSQVVLMTTIVSGFGFAALAFVIVNEIRLSLEKTRVTGRQN